MEWQLIETAPKDGTKVDIWVKGFERTYPKRGKSMEWRITDCRFSQGTWGGWLRGSTGVTGLHFYDDEGDKCFDPTDTSDQATVATHWMSLPPSPSG